MIVITINRWKLRTLRGAKVIGLTGIASPEAFYKLLENSGAALVDKIDFPDHHYFSEEELNSILLKATKEQAIVVTSEKDMVKIRRVSQDSRMLYVDITVDFLKRQRRAFVRY